MADPKSTTSSTTSKDGPPAAAAAERVQDPTLTSAVIPTVGTGPDTVLIGAKDTIGEALFSTAATDEFVTLQQDVVGEFVFPDSVRPAHKILYAKGQVVRRAEIDAHNAAVRQRKLLADNEGVDPANPAGIDSTTIASGTVVSTDSDQAKAVAAGR